MTECAVVDGSGFYDNETNTWHYIGTQLVEINLLCRSMFSRKNRGLESLSLFS